MLWRRAVSRSRSAILHYLVMGNNIYGSFALSGQPCHRFIQVAGIVSKSSVKTTSRIVTKIMTIILADPNS